jgi:error-prone DNA polymerase
MTYVELHCHSYFSLLDGAASPEELIQRAAELGMSSLALTDHDNVYGAVRFAEAAQSAGIRPIFGAEITLTNGYHLTLLVENETGWHNLCQLISYAQHKAPKGQAALPLTVLDGLTDGLIALSGCKKSEITAALRSQDYTAALNAAQRYRDLFGPGNFWIELQHHLQPGDGALVNDSVELAQQLGLGYVAANNVHYATRNGCRLQDVLVCINHQTTLDEAGPLLRPNSEFYLKSARQLTPLFAAYPDALTNTSLIADRCRFTLAYGLQDLPQFPTPANLTATAYLGQLCEAALSQRYPDSPTHARQQLAHELTIIERAGLANYFLIVWDIVRYAGQAGIRCQGRGSAANSLVAYLLNVSPIDPLRHHLVFERFLSAERAVADIDLDFEATDQREKVIQYTYQRYGANHAAMACTFVTFHKRSALRDIAKALGISGSLLQRAADQLAGLASPAESQPEESLLELLFDLCQQVHRFPRHVGLHNGGMVITGSPLATRVPTEPARMINRTVVQWDKDSLEIAGLVKIDILGLRMLSAIADTLQLIAETTGAAPNLDDLSFTDPAVYQMIANADTIGVFQVESRAQAQILPKLQPRCFNDLTVAVSLIRPGPIQGNMVRPYLARRLGLEPVTYAHPLLQEALEETLGVILFQEQVLKVAKCLAGFTFGQGEKLRRALGGKGGAAEIEPFHQAFLSGAQAKGVPADIAETVFDQLRAFGSYAFAKSHASSFAVLVYQSAWLKRYYPVQYYVSLMNNQPMGFWAPSVILGDARRHGILILPVGLHRSQALCIVENSNIRLGFNYVTGLGEDSIARLVAAREEKDFSDLKDFCHRTRLTRRIIENLILAGAMDSWDIPRRRLLWELSQVHYREEALDLVFPTEDIQLPTPTRAEMLLWEHEVLGLSAGDHVMALYRDRLAAQGILGSAELAAQPAGRQVWVAGLVIVHQSPPTANGFHFISLEDSEGLIDVIVRPQIYAHYRRLLHTAPLLLIKGIVQRQDDVVNLMALHVATLAQPSDSFD